MLLGPTITILLASPSSAFAGLQDDLGLRAVLLFRKPAVSTGRLEVVEEGMNVLRAQKEPFCIVSAVGPTRTGKSSMLGRAFFRESEQETLFQVGSGVTSFTGGVWISSRPLEVATASGTLRVLFIDTEGFSGVGSITSKTYEANLFGIVYLLSSVLIFNTMFPVDASTVSSLNAHANHALQMLQALKESGQEVRRTRPRLIWSVQSFNIYNLHNSGMGADDLLSSLRNASQPSSSESALAVLGEAGSSASVWLVERLFEEQQLIPVRRPHHSDEVVANLAKYNSSMLSPDYLQDLEHLRLASMRHTRPVHRCKEKDTLSAADHCTAELLHGSEFVELLGGWLKHGFILDQSDLESSDKANETESLFQLGERNRNWLEKQCKALNEELRTKFYWYREYTTTNEDLRQEAIQAVSRMMKGFRDAALSRLVESGIFWRYPGKGAMLVETQSQQAMHRCKEMLDHTREHMENWRLQWQSRGQRRIEQQPLPHVEGGGKLIYKLQANDSTCFTETNNRIALGSGFTLESCAEEVSTNCKCGRGFEFDESNDGFCGCGAAGTLNTDCTEDLDDFSFRNKRYLLYNPACIHEQPKLSSDRASPSGAGDTAGAAQGGTGDTAGAAQGGAGGAAQGGAGDTAGAAQGGAGGTAGAAQGGAGGAAQGGAGDTAGAAQGGAGGGGGAVQGGAVDAAGLALTDKTNENRGRRVRQVCFDVYD